MCSLNQADSIAQHDEDASRPVIERLDNTFSILALLSLFASPPHTHNGLRVLPAILWAAFILLVLMLPGSTIPRDAFWQFPGYDKVIHGLLFFIQSWTVWIAMYRTTSTGRKLTLVASTALAYGVATEVCQHFAPDRSADFWDVLADAGGIAVFVSCVLIRSATKSLITN